MPVADVISGLLSGGSELAAAYLPYQAAGEASDTLANMANRFIAESGKLGTTAAEAAAFKPFSITTPTGTTSVDQSGIINQQLAAQPAALQQSLMSQAAGLAGTPTASAQDIYSQLQASQAGEAERARLALENRLQAQGRGGVTTAAYGGTPEQLAMEKALQEQSSKNWLAAQTLAPQLQSQQLGNISAALGTSYVPQAQEFKSLEQALQTAKLAQSSKIAQAEALTQAGMTGLQTEADLVAAQAAYEAQRNRDLATALSGMFATSSSGQTTPLNDLITSILGGTPSGSTSSDTSGGGLFGFLGDVFSGSSDTGTTTTDWADILTNENNSGWFGDYYDPAQDWWA